MPKVRIALADDHALVRKGLIAMLADDGYEIIAEAKDGSELLEKLAQLRDLPDICLLDIQMNGMDGYTTLVHLRRLYPELKVLVLSQFDDDLAIIRMLKAGARGFLHKDTDPSELRDAIQTILGGSYYQNSMVNGRIFSLVKREAGDSQSILSDNELLFLRYVGSELTYVQIADRMGLSRHTIDGYRERLFEKLGVKTRTALAIYALKLGIKPLD
jgi:DNA-binding NarL/FixJ family response regulator